MNYLSPEKNIKLLHLYHSSSKLLIPLGFMSYGIHQTKYKNVAFSLDCLNIANFTYHSYVSTSCIITDYIKVRNIEPVIRQINVVTHTFACIGFINLLYKYNKN